MTKYCFALLSFFMLGACSTDNAQDESSTDEQSGDSTLTTQEIQPIPIDITLNKIFEYPNECEVKGKMVDAFTWNDKNGINYFIRTMGPTTEGAKDISPDLPSATQYLYAYHWLEDETGEFKLMREITDFVKDCQFDLILNHELDAITLTDLDEDEIGEITFMYKLACVSDVSPSSQKLILLEDGNKYPFRGNTRVMGMGGDYQVGEEFDEAPESFLLHAQELWEEHLVEYDFDL